MCWVCVFSYWVLLDWFLLFELLVLGFRFVVGVGYMCGSVVPFLKYEFDTIGANDDWTLRLPQQLILVVVTTSSSISGARHLSQAQPLRPPYQ